MLSGLIYYLFALTYLAFTTKGVWMPDRTSHLLVWLRLVTIWSGRAGVGVTSPIDNPNPPLIHLE